MWVSEKWRGQSRKNAAGVTQKVWDVWRSCRPADLDAPRPLLVIINAQPRAWPQAVRGSGAPPRFWSEGRSTSGWPAPVGEAWRQGGPVEAEKPAGLAGNAGAGPASSWPPV